MILYLGSSSLIKMYANEPDSAILLEWVKTAEMVVTCRIAYTEIISALDIRYKQGDLSKHDYDLVLKQFSQDWEQIVRLDFDDYETGMLVKKYGLTRFGALHLSAAKLVASEHHRYAARTDPVRSVPMPNC